MENITCEDIFQAATKNVTLKQEEVFWTTASAINELILAMRRFPTYHHDISLSRYIIYINISYGILCQLNIIYFLILRVTAGD